MEKTHRNLGLPTVFAKMVDLSNLGLLIIGGRSTGKGAILNSVIQLRHRKVIKVGRLTPAGLKKIADDLNEAEVTFINPDITSLYTYYLRDAAINALSHLIYDHELPQSWTDRYDYKIENCYLSFLSGVQPKMIRQLNTLPAWESMYKDRFLRFPLFYPFGTPDYTKPYPEVGQITIPSGFTSEDVTVPRSIRRRRAYYRVKAIIERQTSAGRCGAYTNSLLKAHAFLNERDIATEADLDVLELFTLNLMADYWLSERESLAGALKFEPDSYVLLFYMIQHGSARRKELRKYFKVKQRVLVRYMRPLITRNILMGTYGADVYKLNAEWYAKYVLPIIKWSEKVGVLEAGQITLPEALEAKANEYVSN